MCDLGIHALSQEPQPLRVLGSFALSFPYVGKEKPRLEPGRGVLHAFNT